MQRKKTLNTYIKKKRKLSSQQSNTVKKLEKSNKINPKGNRRTEIINVKSRNKYKQKNIK